MSHISEVHQLVSEKTAACLASFFDDASNNAKNIDPIYGRLWENIERVVMHGGKRLRPYMTAIGYGKFADREIDKIVPIAAAQELLHSAMLMHDDIIDRDDVRHGTDNLHGAYKSIYKSTQEPDLTHYAYSAAILGGDLLLSGAYRLILNSDFSAEQRVEAQKLLDWSIFEVTGGELMDVEASFMPGDLPAISIAAHKTASYSFIGPLTTGAKLAKMPERQVEALRSFGLNFGIAFQLQDDLLGIFGDEKITGKSNVSDLTEAKHTLIIEYYKNSPDHFDPNLFERVFGNSNATKEDIDQLKDSITASEARAKTEQSVIDYIQKAQDALKDLPKDSPARTELDRLVDQSLAKARSGTGRQY